MQYEIVKSDKSDATEILELLPLLLLGNELENDV